MVARVATRAGIEARDITGALLPLVEALPANLSLTPKKKF